MAAPKDLEKVRNIGISAHIDSGKTTLSERILFYTGRIHAIHEVRGKDGVGAKMDSMDLEREKGITIQSAATYCQWDRAIDNIGEKQKHQINLIDTPGHVDFTIEVERALRVLDGAILVLCGVAGVQSQSITVDRQMRRYNVPRLAFINKLDRTGANPFRVTQQLREKLKLNAYMAQLPIGLEDGHAGVVDLVEMKAIYFSGKSGEVIEVKEIPEEMLGQAQEYRLQLIGAAADFDEELAEKFLMEEEVSPSILRRAIRKGTIALKLCPVFMGSAFKNKGVQALLDAVVDYLPSPNDVKNEALDQKNNEARVELECESNKPLVMLAFKLEDGRFGQLTYMRIYQGKVNKGDTIINSSSMQKVRVPRLVRMHSDEAEDIDSASAGDIVAMFGVECASGDTFTDGTVHYTMTSMHVPDAVISLAVNPKDKSGANNFSKALSKFMKEDPTFRVHRDEESGETIISGMGELHLEVYVERMKREFNCEVETGRPQVAFRETITQTTNFMYQHKKQTGGSGQYAKIAGIMEPLPLDEEKAYEFVDEIVGGVIPNQYIPACDKGFQEQLKKGLLIGFPVIGVKMTINDGAYHDVDSSEMAFRICAQTAIREFYHQAKPVVLEPIMKVEVRGPEEYSGTLMGLVNQRRGTILGSSSNEGYVIVEAEVPLTDMFGFSTVLRSGTQGKGDFTMEFCKYSPVPRQIQDEMVKKYQEQRAAENK